MVEEVFVCEILARDILYAPSLACVHRRHAPLCSLCISSAPPQRLTAVAAAVEGTLSSHHTARCPRRRLTGSSTSRRRGVLMPKPLSVTAVRSSSHSSRERCEGGGGGEETGRRGRRKDKEPSIEQFALSCFLLAAASITAGTVGR